MKKKTRFWKIAILLVILLSFAGVISYRVIAGTVTNSFVCPPSPNCPSVINCPTQLETDGESSGKGVCDKWTYKLLLDDGNKKTCPHKRLCDKKPDCDKTAKQCGL